MNFWDSTVINYFSPIGVAAVVFMASLGPFDAPAVSATASSDTFSELRRTKDGITVSRGKGRTRGFYISRFDAVSTVSPEKMAQGLWDLFDNFYPPVVKRTFIHRSADEIIFQDKVKTPVVSDREYTLRVRRFHKDDLLGINFFSDPEAGPAAESGYVRMTMVRGGWEIRPSGDGGSLVRYEIYTEPGGLVPALLIKEPLTGDALNYVRRCLKDAVR